LVDDMVSEFYAHVLRLNFALFFLLARLRSLFLKLLVLRSLFISAQPNKGSTRELGSLSVPPQQWKAKQMCQSYAALTARNLHPTLVASKPFSAAGDAR